MLMRIVPYAPSAVVAVSPCAIRQVPLVHLTGGEGSVHDASKAAEIILLVKQANLTNRSAINASVGPTR